MNLIRQFKKVKEMIEGQMIPENLFEVVNNVFIWCQRHELVSLISIVDCFYGGD